MRMKANNCSEEEKHMLRVDIVGARQERGEMVKVVGMQIAGRNADEYASRHQRRFVC